jgi:arabinose-5-phosphate isomerase
MRSILETAREIIRCEQEALGILEKQLDESFCCAVELISQARGRVVVTGVGKSGLVGRKLAATMASTGTPAFFVHADEALHGDLGMITGDDVVLMISHSGSTPELAAMQSALNRICQNTILIAGGKDNLIGRNCTVVLSTGVSMEADGMNLAPTASTTAAMALGDALALVLSRKKEFSRDDFARCHPGGALGQKLREAKEDHNG